MERQPPGRGRKGPPRCSFCGRSRTEASYMHAGPDWVQICNGCVYGAKALRSRGPGRARHCSFCGAEAKEVEWIHGGSLVAVCNRCIHDIDEEIATS